MNGKQFFKQRPSTYGFNKDFSFANLMKKCLDELKIVANTESLKIRLYTFRFNANLQQKFVIVIILKSNAFGNASL